MSAEEVVMDERRQPDARSTRMGVGSEQPGQSHKMVKLKIGYGKLPIGLFLLALCCGVVLTPRVHSRHALQLPFSLSLKMWACSYLTMHRFL